ncbi:MAG: hypothetical protein AAB434_08235 [Planctomycetota bacterium]
MLAFFLAPSPLLGQEGLIGTWRLRSHTIEIRGDGTAVVDGATVQYSVRGTLLTFSGREGDRSYVFAAGRDTLRLESGGVIDTYKRVVPAAAPPTREPAAAPPTREPGAAPPTREPDAAPPTREPDVAPPTREPDAAPPTRDPGTPPAAAPPTISPEPTERGDTGALFEPSAEEAAALEALRESPTRKNREALAKIRAAHATAMLELARNNQADVARHVVALDLALRYAHSAKELAPDSALYWFLLAQAYAEGAEDDTALTMAHNAVAKASSLAPLDNRIRLLFGHILFREEFYASSLDQFETAITSEPSLAVPDLIAIMTVAYTLDCLAWRGEEFMARLAAADPDAHTARLAMAILQHHQGKDDLAYPELLKVARSATAGQRERDYAVRLAGDWRKEAPLPPGK